MDGYKLNPIILLFYDLLLEPIDVCNKSPIALGKVLNEPTTTNFILFK